MFPGVSRDTRQPKVVSLELNAPGSGGRSDIVDAVYSRHHQRKQPKRSFSPHHADATAAPDDVRESSESGWREKTAVCRSSLANNGMPLLMTVSLDGLPRDSSNRQHYNTNPDKTTSTKMVIERLPPLFTANSEVSEALLQQRKCENADREFHVRALRLKPDIKATKTQFRQQQSAVDHNNENEETARSEPVTSTSFQTEDNINTGVKFALRLPLSDNDNEHEDKDDDLETAEGHHCGGVYRTSTIGSANSGTPGILEDGCAIMSVRIEFSKSQRNTDTDADIAIPPVGKESDIGRTCIDETARRRPLGRTPPKMKNVKIALKPMSPSKAISVAGRGKVVVIDDGVYDQFARRHPPKYVTNKSFDAMFNKRVFNR